MSSSSRWDSLKPKQRETTRNQQRKNKSNGRQPHVDADKPQPRDDDDILDRFAALHGRCRQKHAAAKSVAELAHFVVKYCSYLPAEETAVTVVHEIFLPRLSDDDGVGNDIHLPILQAVDFLLLSDKHASAILASLTEMVEETGAEQIVVNPVRSRLFQVLGQTLPSSVSCLTTALRVSKRIDGCTGVTIDVNLHMIQEFLKSAFETDENPQSVLNLLLALLQRNPGSAPSLARMLLLRDSSYCCYPSTSLNSKNAAPTCCVCGFRHDGAPAFLRILHGRDRPSVATECATELLHALPLHLWLLKSKNKSSPTKKKQQVVVRSSSAFQSSVNTALEDLVRIALCRTDDYVIADSSSSLFVKAILTQVPYGHNSSYYCGDAYQELAVKLVDKLATSRNSVHASAMLADCLGGRMTPSGQLTERSIPVTTWLRSARGCAFVEEQLVLWEQQQQQQQQSSKLMYAILRACPDVVMNHSSAWSQFQNAVDNQRESNPLIVAQWIEGLLRGRNDHMIELSSAEVMESELLEFAVPMLATFVSAEHTEKVECTGCSGFSCLQPTDWNRLSANADSYIARVLALCTDCSSAAVKTASYKAVGDICSNYVPNECFQLGRDGAAGSLLCNKIFRSMLQTMTDDELGSVQCMVLFAVGNLAQALHSRSLPGNGLDAHLVCAVAESSLALMANPNEKVAVNAVRATGWLACLVLQYRDYLETARSDFRAAAFLGRVVQTLAQNVRSAVSLALWTGEVRFSWKQRSGIKKQGWGACNALAILFVHDISNEMKADGTASICQEAVACLMDCVENVSVLNEKVAISALTALRSLDRVTLARMSLGDATLGKAMAACSVFLFDELSDSPSTNQLLRGEVELLLAHLLPCATVLDVQQSLQSDALLSRLGRLCEWMVEQECSSVVFRFFALALQISGVCVDMHVEQQFSNRAKSLDSEIMNDQLDEL